LLLRAAVVLVGFSITGSLLIDRGAVPLVVAAVELIRILVRAAQSPGTGSFAARSGQTASL
jgi:uncharacterized membrane protein YadS